MVRKKVNVVVGRFQPLTIGHLQMAKDLTAENGLPVVYIYIRSKSGQNSHFSDNLTEEMFKRVINKYSYIIDSFSMDRAFIPVTILELQRRGYEPILIGAGPDRFDEYNKMVARMTKIETDEEFKIYHLTKRITSATEVRNAIKEENESKFKKLTPSCIHSLYDKLKEELSVLVEENLNLSDEQFYGQEYSEILKENQTINNNYKTLLTNNKEILEEVKNWVSKNGFKLTEKEVEKIKNIYVPEGSTKVLNLFVYENEKPCGNLTLDVYNSGNTENSNIYEMNLHLDRIKYVNSEEVNEFRKMLNLSSIKKSLQKTLSNLKLFKKNKGIKNNLSESEIYLCSFNNAIPMNEIAVSIVSNNLDVLKTNVDDLMNSNSDTITNLISQFVLSSSKSLSYEDYCSIVMNSPFIKNDLKPKLMISNLNDFQVKNFIDNMCKVSYQYYVNYYKGGVCRAYVKK